MTVEKSLGCQNPTDNIEPSDLFDYFLSAEMSDENLDILVAPRISRDKWKVGVRHYNTKWYDYRFISPARCVTYYAHYFVKTYRQYSSLYKLGNSSVFMDEKISPWQYSQSIWTTFLRGSQMADQYGIPYDYFIQNGLKDCFKVSIDVRHHMKKAGRGIVVPQSNQLYGQKRVGRLLEMWSEKIIHDAPFARHPFYTDEMYRGTPIQKEYREYAISVIKSSNNVSSTLYDILYVRKQLSEKVAVENFTDREVTGAKILNLA